MKNDFFEEKNNETEHYLHFHNNNLIYIQYAALELIIRCSGYF